MDPNESGNLIKNFVVQIASGANETATAEQAALRLLPALGGGVVTLPPTETVTDEYLLLAANGAGGLESPSAAIFSVYLLGKVQAAPLIFSARPSCSVTAAPTSDSHLMRRADGDARYLQTKQATLLANETGDENTTTLKTSATLALALEPGTWDFEALIVVDCNSTTAGSRQKLNFSGTASSIGGIVYGTDNGSANSTSYPSARASGSAVDYERFATGSSIATLRTGRIVVTGTGTLSAQFAQRTATASTSPTLVAGSYLKATRVA